MPGGRIFEARDDLLHGVDDVESYCLQNAQHVQIHAVLAVDRDRLRLRATSVFDGERRLE